MCIRDSAMIKVLHEISNTNNASDLIDLSDTLCTLVNTSGDLKIAQAAWNQQYQKYNQENTINE